MQQIVMEKYVEDMETELYPVTLMKYILNKKKIMRYFSNAANPEFKKKSDITVDHKDCKICKEKEKDGILCRQHTSIHRVLNAKKVAMDTDTGVLFYKNEIYKMSGNNLVLIYCPHTKLLKGDITDEKVRKINPLTISDEKLELPKYEIVEFSSALLMSTMCKCWFNDDYSIVSIPSENGADWAITSNK